MKNTKVFGQVILALLVVDIIKTGVAFLFAFIR